MKLIKIFKRNKKTTNKNRNKWEKYPKMVRLENLIVEEKIDGSNMSLDTLTGNVYSRNRKVSGKEKVDTFFKPFIEYLQATDLIILRNMGIRYIFFEAIGMAEIDYGLNKKDPAQKRLYLIDAVFNDGGYADRAKREELAEILKIEAAPLTTYENKKSLINPEVNREGYVLRGNNRNNTDIKIKVIEHKFKGRDENSGNKIEIKTIE